MTRDASPALPATWPPGYPRHVPVSAERARALDRAASAEFGIPSLVLMEHAAQGIAALAARLCPAPGAILVCAGPGNNGGDGYGAARFLRAWGREVRVLRMSRDLPRSDDARRQARLCAAAGPIEAIHETPDRLAAALGPGNGAHPGLVVDALFGVGLVRLLEAPWRGWIGALNGSGIPVLAVDLPSGLHTDSGEALPVAVQAEVTATMAAPKTGVAPGSAGAAAAGRIVEVDIGLPRALLRPLELPARPA